MLHKKPDKNIVQDNADEYQKEIPEQLYPPMKYRAWKDHMAHEHKSGRKTDEKGYDESGNMGFKRNESQV
jgi:hypothetical protein